MSTTWVSVSRRVRLLATVVILAAPGMSEPALRVAGGILPLIAGPGSMSATTLLMAATEENIGQQAVVIAALLGVLRWAAAG